MGRKSVSQTAANKGSFDLVQWFTNNAKATVISAVACEEFPAPLFVLALVDFFVTAPLRLRVDPGVIIPKRPGKHSAEETALATEPDVEELDHAGHVLLQHVFGGWHVVWHGKEVGVVLLKAAVSLFFCYCLFAFAPRRSLSQFFSASGKLFR